MDIMQLSRDLIFAIVGQQQSQTPLFKLNLFNKECNVMIIKMITKLRGRTDEDTENFNRVRNYIKKKKKNKQKWRTQ